MLLAMPLAALAEAGRVLLAVGDVVAERGAQRIALARGAAVEVGDTIRTGADSNAQIRMTDGAILALRERTVLRIDEHVFSGKVDGSERSFLSLLAGGVRAVTGLIGALRRDDKYGVRTPTASIGIRGTHYTLRECNDLSPCPLEGARAELELAQAPGAASDAPALLAQAASGGFAAPGTYGGVSDGAIAVMNEAGEAQFGAREFFHVPDRKTAPQALIAPPRFLYDRLGARTRTAGQAGAESGERVAGGIGAESRQLAPAPPTEAPGFRSNFVATENRGASGSPSVVPTQEPLVAGVGAFFDAVNSMPGDGGGFFPPSQATLAGSGPSAKLLDFFILPGDHASPGGGSGVSGGAAASEGDVVAETSPNPIGAIWGRWLQGGFVESDGATPTVHTISPTNALHYLSAPPTPPEVIAAKTGLLSLVDIGGTTPTNNFGQTGSFSISGATVDFASKVFSASSFGFVFASQTWSFGAASAPLQALPGKGVFFTGAASGTCAGACGSTATLGMTGVFMGKQGDHVGIGLSAVAPGGHASTARLLGLPSL